MEHKKKVIIGSLIGLAVLGGVTIFALSISKAPTIPTNLTEEERIMVSERLVNLEAQLKEAKEAGEESNLFNIYMSMGVQHRLLGNYKQAMDSYSSAEEWNTENLAHPFVGKYTVASSAEEWDKALVSIEQAIAIDPSHIDYQIWRLQILEDKKKESLDILISEYQRVFQELGESDRFVGVYAEFLERTGDREGALSLWKSLLEKEGIDRDFIQNKIKELSK